MSPTRLVIAPVLGLGVVCLMGITLLGGCPQQQIPTPPPVVEPNTPTPSDQSGPGTQDRPIPSPPIDSNTPAPTPPPGGDTTGDGTSNTGEGGTATFSVRWNAPLTPLALRTGTPVDLIFKLSDTQNVVDSAELVVARDNDADGLPDANPVATQAISVAPGTNTIAYDTNQAAGLLSNGFGRFVLGLRLHSSLGEQQTTYAPGRLTIDGVAPSVTWIAPTTDALVNPQDWRIQLQTTDNSDHTVRVVLDDDTTPGNGYAAILVADTTFGPGTATLDVTVPLSVAPKTYFYYVIVTDGIDPATTLYPQAGGQKLRLMVTNRVIGTYDLNRLAQFSSGASEGAILQGFNFNDLAGSSLAAVPDLTGDGQSELLIASRFGKPYTVNTEGVGWGEAYLVYGSSSRLRGVRQLNSIGRGAVPGLAFPGIRTPMANSWWTEGLSDVTVIPDMDGDSLPELVFSFPRVESVSLRNTADGVQHPDLIPDYPGEGALEYDADEHAQIVFGPLQLGFTYNTYYWEPNTAQFTRGGVVILSSHSPMLQTPDRFNRKGDRVVDLAEVGQLFVPNSGAPRYFDFLWHGSSVDETITCVDPNDPNATPEEQDYAWWFFEHDTAFENQGPGGFDNHFSAPQIFGTAVSDPTAIMGWRWDPDPFQPPLANVRPLADSFDFLWTWPVDDQGFYMTFGDPCVAPNCVYTDFWTPWYPFPVEHVDVSTLDPQMYSVPGWHGGWSGAQTGWAIWTGFVGGHNFTARVYPGDGGDECGARILGQRVDDRFGTAVGSDGDHLYMSAPLRTALRVDVPQLEADRDGAGVVYQLRTNAQPGNSPFTMTQLWIEPDVLRPDPNDPNGLTFFVNPGYPFVDAEDPNHIDYSIPTPHQYIIENVGSTRGDDRYWPELGLFDAPRLPQAEVGTPDWEWMCDYSFGPDGCDGAEEEYVNWMLGVPANTISESDFWHQADNTVEFESSEYFVQRTSQIVGPHKFANLSFVRGLGDVNGDGVADFAVGSQNVQQTFIDPQNPSGPTVGAVFIVFNQILGLEGDYLLDRMALPTSANNRVHGVLLHGSSANEKMGRVFDDAHDFDGNGVSDVVVGAEGYDANRGQAVVILGSSTVESPGGGWMVSDILTAGRGIRFAGEAQGDLAGANVAGAGDVDGDGFSDILIAAPGANGGTGAVYLIYGSNALAGKDVSLSLVGSLDLPGAKFIGRAPGDQLGGGQIEYPGGAGIYLNPNGDPSTIYSRGVVSLGDIDGDGFTDFAISAMLANPNARVRAGEVYILYGRGDQ